VALGWVTEMPALIGGADVVVQNAGGLTSLEAMSAGVPVLSYRCLPGHGTTNAAALDRARLAPWITERAGLAPALRRALTDGPGPAVARLFGGPTAVDAVRAVLAATTSSLVPAPLNGWATTTPSNGRPAGTTPDVGPLVRTGG
jgi:UDP:flavonoid glycosyltransferase YjiC (YdhE family)